MSSTDADITALKPPRKSLWMLAFACALLGILAIGFVSYTEMSVLANSSARVQRSYDVLQTLHDLKTALTDTETNQRGYLLTQDRTYLDQYDAAIAQIRLALTELRRLSQNEQSTHDAVGHLAQLASAKLDEMQHSIHALERGEQEDALAHLANGPQGQIMEAFRRDTLELEVDQRQLLDLHRQREYRARLASEGVLVATVLLSLLFVGAATLISRRFDERRRLLEREIAERKKAEERREALLTSERAARSEAERATRLKDEFVATMSHELRTPLNAIVGWASILRHDRNAKVVSQGVEVIDRNAKLQARMVEDLLDMSRILSGKLAMELQRTDLAGVIEAAVAAVRPSADNKLVRIHTSIEPTRPVNGDPGRLQQVLWNLLTNAIKFTPSDGLVTVFAREVTRDGTAHVEISVSDSGQGIDADEREEPASLTKLMTSYAVFKALKENRLKLTDPITISEHAWRSEGSRTIRSGWAASFPPEILIKGMIVQSGNDATIALAEKIGGTEPAFAELTNEYAKRSSA